MEIKQERTSSPPVEAGTKLLLPVNETLRIQHQQLRQQLVNAILLQTASRSLGAGWSTVLAPVDSVQPLLLDRGFVRPTLRALYVNDPTPESGEIFSVVAQIEGEPRYSGAYVIEVGPYDQSTILSTNALLTLLSVLEAGEFQVDQQSSARY